MGSNEHPRGMGWLVAVVSVLALAAGNVGCGPRTCVYPEILVGGECVLSCTSASDPRCLIDGALPDGARPDGALPDGFDGSADVGPDVLRCEAPLEACDGRCVSITDDPEHCGGCGQQCGPYGRDRVSVCQHGFCGGVCAPGRHDCLSECLLDDSPYSCGSACTPCPAAPANAHATCNAGACGWECNVGFQRVGAGCVLQAARPMAPLSTATVTSQQPTLRWELPAGADGARIELCRDRALTRQCQTVEANGTSGRPASPLEPGVWFWRLRARVGSAVDPRASAVWQFTVGHRSAPVDTSSGTTLDLNGDGYADLAVVAPYVSWGHPSIHVYFGSATGLSATPAVGLEVKLAAGGRGLVNAGDVNGDGYADLAAFASESGDLRVHVYLGSATGPGLDPDIRLQGPDRLGLGELMVSAGDLNGDGYADFAVAVPDAMGGAGQVHVYYGSGEGLRFMPSLSLTGREARGRFGSSLTSVGDVNGDGYADLAVGASREMDDGRVHLFLGSATGLNATPALTLSGANGPDDWYFGALLAGGVDVNGDGHPDLVVGGARDMRRTVYVYLGSATGLSATPARSFDGQDEYGLGSSLASAGDLNGDGYADLVVAVPQAMDGTGRMDVYLGSATGLSATPAQSLNGPDGPSRSLGWPLAGNRDFDGDGYADLAVGASIGPEEIGRVHVYRGSATGLRATPSQSLEGPEGEQRGFGNTLARAVRRAPVPASVRTAEHARSHALVCREAPSA